MSKGADPYSTIYMLSFVRSDIAPVSKGYQTSQVRELSIDTQMDEDEDEDLFNSLEEQKGDMRIDFREVGTVQAQPLHQTQSLNLGSMVDKALSQVSEFKQKGKGAKMIKDFVQRASTPWKSGNGVESTFFFCFLLEIRVSSFFSKRRRRRRKKNRNNNRR